MVLCPSDALDIVNFYEYGQQLERSVAEQVAIDADKSLMEQLAFGGKVGRAKKLFLTNICPNKSFEIVWGPCWYHNADRPVQILFSEERSLLA